MVRSPLTLLALLGLLACPGGGSGPTRASQPPQDRRNDPDPQPRGDDPPPGGAEKPYHAKTVNNTHCFSVMEIDGDKLVFRQVDEDGREVDRFTLTH